MGPRGPRTNGRTADKKLDFGTLVRLLKYFTPYIPRLIAVVACIIVTALVTVESATFIGKVIDIFIEPALDSGAELDTAGLVLVILRMAIIYAAGIIASFANTRLMITVSQGILRDIRDSMFKKMQTLPIKYFDTHSHGNIMSLYTNDTDTLRQMISQTLPQIISSFITITTVFVTMLVTNPPLTGFTVITVIAMLAITRKIGFASAKHFVAQQQTLGSLNGFVEEMVNGQKVVQVFNREPAANDEFKRRNESLRDSATKANILSNIIGPVNNNLGHLSYVLVAVAGSIIAILTGGVGLFALSLGGVVSFLNLFRNFQQPINMVMQQFNVLVMAMAGAGRIFSLLDEEPETDNGDITLVNCRLEQNGEITECTEKTGEWAWKCPTDNGNYTLVPVRGDVLFFDVDFGYSPDKTVLHDITLYAKPGQKLAFVGATGAGKTTITNLINRFYDLADGKISYDGIDINRISKPSLRRSLGMVLQDGALFSGSVMENIRYGNPDASDDACIEAAKLAGADGFIRMLPMGYNTDITGDGSGLSQGQRQLIAIARAAVMDPPVMILDEATSSIDTRTEAIVQRGMDMLMNGRTVFVIAHRLSTVRNSNAIIVLEHGVVIERGTHNQLIEQQGKYYRLYTGAFELE